MDTTDEKVHFIENEAFNKLVKESNDVYRATRRESAIASAIQKLVEEKERIKNPSVDLTAEKYALMQDVIRLTAERDNLSAENDDLKTQLAKTEKALKATEGKLKETKIDLQDKEISFSAVMSILKYYLDFFEALNPSKKAFENAMKKMKSK